ncbi:MAG: DUF2066 domain-containing protein [Alphaproteobacteria bacterium]|nr:DUF2066 domain-containing protein [Alphaproteobacteria bacterium]
MLKSRHRAPLAAIAGLALALAAPPASSQEGDLFTAYAIAVDAEAKTAAQARDVALISGQREAFRTVLKRLTLAEDWGRLPKLSTAQIVAMVAALQFGNEKTSSVRYLADLTVEFKKGPIRSLLRASDIPFTETRARPTLALPVLESGDNRLLFDDNPWLLAWAGQDVIRGAMFPIVVPIGDLEDVAIIDAETAVTGDEAALAAIAERYRTTNVMVVVASLVEGAGKTTIDLERRWHGPLKSGTEISSLKAGAEESTEALLARAVAETMRELEEEWKRETLLQFDQEQRLSVRVPIESLADWIEVRRRIGRNGMVRTFEVASITRQAVQLYVDYLGDPRQLAISLAQEELELIEEDGFWVLNLRRGTGGTARE